MRYIKKVDWIIRANGEKSKFNDLIIKTNNVWTYLLLNWFMCLYLSLAIPIFGMLYRITLKKNIYYQPRRNSKRLRTKETYNERN